MDGTDPSMPLDFDRDAYLMPKQIHEASDEYWEKVVANNTTGMFKSLRAELRQMVLQGQGGSSYASVPSLVSSGYPGTPLTAPASTV